MLTTLDKALAVTGECNQSGTDASFIMEPLKGEHR